MIGLVLDGSTTFAVVQPPVDASTAVVALHVVTPTVPAPTLVDGRPA